MSRSIFFNKANENALKNINYGIKLINKQSSIIKSIINDLNTIIEMTISIACETSFSVRQEYRKSISKLIHNIDNYIKLSNKDTDNDLLFTLAYHSYDNINGESIKFNKIGFVNYNLLDHLYYNKYNIGIGNLGNNVTTDSPNNYFFTYYPVKAFIEDHSLGKINLARPGYGICEYVDDLTTVLFECKYQLKNKSIHHNDRFNSVKNDLRFHNDDDNIYIKLNDYILVNNIPYRITNIVLKNNNYSKQLSNHHSEHLSNNSDKLSNHSDHHEHLSNHSDNCEHLSNHSDHHSDHHEHLSNHLDHHLDHHSDHPNYHNLKHNLRCSTEYNNLNYTKHKHRDLRQKHHEHYEITKNINNVEYNCQRADRMIITINDYFTNHTKSIYKLITVIYCYIHDDNKQLIIHTSKPIHLLINEYILIRDIAYYVTKINSKCYHEYKYNSFYIKRTDNNDIPVAIHENILSFPIYKILNTLKMVLPDICNEHNTVESEIHGITSENHQKYVALMNGAINDLNILIEKNDILIETIQMEKNKLD